MDVSWSGISIIEQFLANPPYHPAFIFAHPAPHHLQVVIEQLQRQYQWPTIAMNDVLAPLLLDTSPAQRPRQTPRYLANIIRTHAPGPLLCTDIDVLFEPALRLDPLRLFLEVSRQTTLVIAWTGSYQENKVRYAVPEHTHYRVWSQPDLCNYCVVQLDDSI